MYDLHSEAAGLQLPSEHIHFHTRDRRMQKRARQTVYFVFLRTATVFVLLSAGVLHSCGHVVSGLHIWRAPHPETSLPWKI